MLELAGHSIRAVSVGGLETCIELPHFKLCFDIGRCPPTATRLPTVLFTHAHTDHMGGVIHHCATRDMTQMPPPTYVMPNENVEAFQDMVAAWRRLDRSPLPCTVVGVSPGDEHDLGKGRTAHIFRAIHRVPSVGYAISTTKRVLKPELRGLDGFAIRDLRADGVEIHDVRETVEVAFCGDTTIDVVDREARVRTARVLILEVTFLDDRVSVAKARGKGHVHFDEVVERADLFENEVILLTHRSIRYGNEQAEKLVRERLPAHLSDRVVLLHHQAPWDR